MGKRGYEERPEAAIQASQLHAEHCEEESADIPSSVRVFGFAVRFVVESANRAG
jgi:hypothetical protein